MRKDTDIQFHIHPVLRKRWSTRAFSDLPIDREKLYCLFEAASWAFSSMNEQPWRYIYALRGSESFEQMVHCLSHGNQAWAKNASVLVLSIAKTTFEKDGSPNRHAYHDVGAANASLAFEATSQGIMTHFMGGFDQQKTREVFNLGKDLDPVAFIAIGYYGNAEDLPEPFKTRETNTRTRKDIDEIVVENKGIFNK